MRRILQLFNICNNLLYVPTFPSTLNTLGHKQPLHKICTFLYYIAIERHRLYMRLSKRSFPSPLSQGGKHYLWRLQSKKVAVLPVSLVTLGVRQCFAVTLGVSAVSDKFFESGFPV